MPRNGEELSAGLLPDFIAVGPPRTGTTWLHRVLRGHVGLPSIKETQFFAYNYGLGVHWYRSYFRDCRQGFPAGEIAPTYFDHPEARARIAAVIPNCRIICSLRDPVERAYSHYKAWRRAGLLDGSFEDVVKLSWPRVSANYVLNLRAWNNMFGTENVLVMLYDDLCADPQAYLDRVCGFVGIAHVDLSAAPGGAEPVNLSEQAPRSMVLARSMLKLRDALIRRRFRRLARLVEAGTPLWKLFFAGGRPYPPLDPAVDIHLRHLLKPEIEDLESLLGRELSAWKTPLLEPRISSRAWWASRKGRSIGDP
jgi:Sulfotransferase domain